MNFLFKRPMKRMKRQAKEWEEVCASLIADKGLVLRIQKEHNAQQ